MEMPRRRLRLTDVNEHLICMLCGGYYIDATTIVECLHSFCRSCLIKYLENNSYCPICEVQIHKAKPFLNIKPDEALQDIVYKLVPGLYHSEMKRRREFYAKHPEHIPLTTPEERGTSVERIVFSPDESISLSLEYLDTEREKDEWESLSSRSSESGVDNTESSSFSKRYLLCPAQVTVGHLKKFIKLKYELRPDNVVEIMHRRETLSDEYTLMDIAYIYTWKRNSPMQFFYRIFQPEDVVDDSGGSGGGEQSSSAAVAAGGSEAAPVKKTSPRWSRAIDKPEALGAPPPTAADSSFEPPCFKTPHLPPPQRPAPDVDARRSPLCRQDHEVSSTSSSMEPAHSKARPDARRHRQAPQVPDDKPHSSTADDAHGRRTLPDDTSCDAVESTSSVVDRVSPAEPPAVVPKTTSILESLFAKKDAVSSTSCLKSEAKTGEKCSTSIMTQSEGEKSSRAEDAAGSTSAAKPASSAMSLAAAKPPASAAASSSRALVARSGQENDAAAASSRSKAEFAAKISKPLPMTARLNCTKEASPASGSNADGTKKEGTHSKLSNVLNNHQQILKKNDEIAASSDTLSLIKRQLSNNVNETLRRKLLQHSERNNLKPMPPQFERVAPANDGKPAAKKRRVNNHIKESANGIARGGILNYALQASLADRAGDASTSAAGASKWLPPQANEVRASDGTKPEENGTPYFKAVKREKRSPSSDSQPTSVPVPASKSLLLSTVSRGKPQSAIAAEIAARGISITSIPVSGARIDLLSNKLSAANKTYTISCTAVKKDSILQMPNSTDVNVRASPSPHRDKFPIKMEVVPKTEMMKMARDSGGRKSDCSSFLAPQVPRDELKKVLVNVVASQRQAAAGAASASGKASTSGGPQMPRLIELHAAPAKPKTAAADKRPPRTPTPALGRRPPSAPAPTTTPRDCIGALDLSASPRRPPTAPAPPSTILSIAQTLARRRQQAASAPPPATLALYSATPPPQLRIPVPQARAEAAVLAAARGVRPPGAAGAAALMFRQQLELQRLWANSPADWYGGDKRLEHFMKSLGRPPPPAFFHFNNTGSSNATSSNASCSNSNTAASGSGLSHKKP